jgi:aminoglycoside 2'-N-acetyltransferase I
MPATVQRSPTPPEGVEAMVRLAFGEGEDALRPEDWGHALGGVHLTAWLDGAPVGHAAVVARRLWCGERELRAGYVEAVATHPGHRRRGIGHALMAAAEAEVAAFELGALAPSDDGLPLYRARGWTPWGGPTAVRRDDGTVERTPEEDGWIFVWPSDHGLDADAVLVCDDRPGDPW